MLTSRSVSRCRIESRSWQLVRVRHPVHHHDSKIMTLLPCVLDPLDGFTHGGCSGSKPVIKFTSEPDRPCILAVQDHIVIPWHDSVPSSLSSSLALRTFYPSP